MTDHALYRFFNDDDELLYIGITLNVSSRFRGHARDKPWWTEVHRITLEHYADRPTVLVAEAAAIRAEKPRYNVAHNPGPRYQPAQVKPRPLTVEQMTPEQFANYMLDRHPRVHGPWPVPEDRWCSVCGQVLAAPVASFRRHGEIRVVHRDCRDRWFNDHPEDKPDTVKAFREERAAAIVRGDIA